MTPNPRSVLLRFDPRLNTLNKGKELREGLSLVVAAGDTLWLASDETTRVERLTRQDEGIYAGHTPFALGDYLSLPGSRKEEVDIEGISYEDDYLWIVGSHSLKRGKPRRAGSVRKNLKRLTRIGTDANRYLLARIPLVERDGERRLVKTYKAGKGRKLTAARLRGDDKGNDLTRALRRDPHIGPFLSIPSKDNGFDIEGMTVAQDRIFLGLRGPVLRGWAIILELRTKQVGKACLRLRKIGPNGALYRKHFLGLNGLGIRELSLDGSDILILAGPTMGLDGPVEILRWRGGAGATEERLVPYEQLERVTTVPYGQEENAGKDHAEGMAILTADGKRSLLVVYDSPCDPRKPEPGTFRADLFDVL